MIEELQRDEAMPLPDQISRIIRSRIESGEYRPGKRLGTIRQFAKDFEVSPVTVIKALDILEEETLIERIPVKGVFVSENLKLEKQQLNACFAFPEKEMAPEVVGNENWGLSYELLRGLFAGAQKCRINLQFSYFEDEPSPELLERQKAALRNFDFVIFPGENHQIDLREASAQERLTVYLGSSSLKSSALPSAAVKLDYDRLDAERQLFSYFMETGCQRALVLSRQEMPTSRSHNFLEKAVRSGLAERNVRIREISDKDPDQPGSIKKILRWKPEFIFVDYTEYMPLIFEAAFDLGLNPGKDFIVTGIASGMTFNGLFPKFSYFRIPRYEMGMQLMQSAEEIIRSGRKTGTIPELKVEFIEAKNHTHKKGKVPA